jgi:hypothetical protein
VTNENATVDRRTKKREHLLLVSNRAVAKAHSHATQPESRNFQISASKFALLHFLNGCLCVKGGSEFELRLRRRQGQSGASAAWAVLITLRGE